MARGRLDKQTLEADEEFRAETAELIAELTVAPPPASTMGNVDLDHPQVKKFFARLEKCKPQLEIQEAGVERHG